MTGGAIYRSTGDRPIRSDRGFKGRDQVKRHPHQEAFNGRSSLYSCTIYFKHDSFYVYQLFSKKKAPTDEKPPKAPKVKVPGTSRGALSRAHEAEQKGDDPHQLGPPRYLNIAETKELVHWIDSQLVRGISPRTSDFLAKVSHSLLLSLFLSIFVFWIVG